jgi:hypothetical protein
MKQLNFSFEYSPSKPVFLADLKAEWEKDSVRGWVIPASSVVSDHDDSQIRVVGNGWEILSQAIPTNEDRFVIKRIARFGEAVFKDEIKAKAEDKSFVLGAIDWGYLNDKMPWELQNLKKLLKI